MAMPIEKLKKVIDMAKRGGSEGERANAKRIAERACAELGIKYDDAVAGRFGTRDTDHEDSPFVWWEHTDTSGFYGRSSSSSSHNYDSVNNVWEDIMQRQRESYKAQAEKMNEYYKKQAEKQKKRQAIYTDKFGEKWAGIEVENLSKERRYKLFGLDPMV